MESIKVSKSIKLKDPYLIVAWPGMGEVAFKAATYLVEKLAAIEFAQIPPQDFFYVTGVNISKGIINLPALPYSKFYYWKNSAASRGAKAGKNDLVIFVSNAQPDLAKAESYSQEIVNFAKSLGVKTVISFAAMPQPIDHTQEVKVWFSATSSELNNNLKKFGLSLMAEGQISGMNGLLLGIAKKAGLAGICLLGEMPLYTIQIENPRASYAALEALSKILNIQIDFSDLLNQAHIMEEEINKLLDFLKLGPSNQAAPIGEEEIEKIKKSLSQLTRLPLSIKEKIDKLFDQAKTDIQKANELKVELDKWSVYKEYEDKFLDLFKKPKEKGN